MISSKKETLNFGMTCFKGTETKKRQRKRDVQSQISSLQSITVCVCIREISSSAVTQIPLADGLQIQTRPKTSKPNTTERTSY